MLVRKWTEERGVSQRGSIREPPGVSPTARSSMTRGMLGDDTAHAGVADCTGPYIPSDMLKGLLKGHMETLPNFQLVNDRSALRFRGRHQQGGRGETGGKGSTQRALKSNREFAPENEFRIADEEKSSQTHKET